MNRRLLLRRIRARFKGHHPGAESRLRALLERAIRPVRKEHVQEFVKHHRRDAPRPRTVVRGMLRKQAKRVADQLAKDVRDQVARAVGVKPEIAKMVDLEDTTWNLADGVVRIFEDYSLDALRRAHDLLSEALEEDVKFGIETEMEAAEGSAFASLGRLFGDIWAQMNHSAQEQLGVEGYLWIAMHDNKTRESHAELDDGTVYSWDDPPLKAEDSDTGEDCHPGNDWGCRCVASPVSGEEQDALEE